MFDLAIDMSKPSPISNTKHEVIIAFESWKNLNLFRRHRLNFGGYITFYPMPTVSEQNKNQLSKYTSQKHYI